jgi:hypothetical protein
MADETIPLSEVVSALRTEILTAVEQAGSPDLKFKLGAVDVEFTVVVKKEGGADAKLKFSILGVGVEGGASGKVAREQTQKVKLSLTPVFVGADGQPRERLINRGDAEPLVRQPQN